MLKYEDFSENIKNNFSKEELDFILKKADIVYDVCICLFLEDNIFIEIVGGSKELQIYHYKDGEGKYISKKDFMDLIHTKKSIRVEVIEV